MNMIGWRMLQATSALGVIAIVFIAVAVIPAAEANGRCTNCHLNESAVTKTIDDVPIDQENMSQMDEDSVVELQRNQSNPLPVTMSQNGVHEPQNFNSLGLDAMSAVPETSENKVEHAKNNFDATPSYKAENASNIIPFVALPHNGPHEDPHNGSSHEDPHNGPHEDPHNGPHEDPHNGPHQDPHNGPHEDPHNGPHENPHNGSHEDPHEDPHKGPHEDPHEGKLIKNSGVYKITKNSGVDKLIKNSGVDKLINNSSLDKNHGENALILKEFEGKSRQQRGIEDPGDTQLYTLDPILLVNMTMYDEYEDIGPPTTTTTRRPDWYLYPPKNFTYVDISFGKFGPFFEEGDADVNVSVRVYNILKLNCRIGMRNKSEVTWTHQLGDELRLLTVGYTVYTTDPRVKLGKGFQLNCQLQVWRTTMADAGTYKCQIPSNPPLLKQYNVEVTAPQLKITDDIGQQVIEDLQLEAGATLTLRCEAIDIRESLKEVVIWAKGYEKITEGITVNETTAISGGKKVHMVISTLIMKDIFPHVANYSCVVPRRISQTILVNVTEVESSAMQGYGMLDIWILIVGIICTFSV